MAGACWDFSSATVEDLPEVARLIQRLSIGWEGEGSAPGRRGFLLPMENTTDLEQFLRAGTTLLARERGQVAGFLILLEWDSPENRGTREILSPPGDLRGLRWIEKVAVAPEQMGTGLARELYDRVLAWRPEAPHACCIVEKPFSNDASVRFHEKLGFRRVGTFQTATFRGLSPYQSGIYFRDAAAGLMRGF